MPNIKLFLGIDDTDDAASRGTGYRARQLGKLLTDNKLAELIAITRHQLLLHPRINYTSHNSSACLDLCVAQETYQACLEFCCEYISRTRVPTSDTGMCFATQEDINGNIRHFGLQAKVKVMGKDEAQKLVGQEGIVLVKSMGTGEGIIGALAAVGLRATGNDGRFIWLQGMRELTSSVYTPTELQQKANIYEVQNVDGVAVLPTAKILVGKWVRPILKENHAVLLVHEVKDNEKFEWCTVPKETVQKY
ncbi:MAG: hypothetical protein AB1345_12200 [Chloroflexota bacterium]